MGRTRSGLLTPKPCQSSDAQLSYKPERNVRAADIKTRKHFWKVSPKIQQLDTKHYDGLQAQDCLKPLCWMKQLKSLSKAGRWPKVMTHTYL